MRDDHSASRRIDVLQAEAPHLIASELTEADFAEFSYYACSVCGHVETRQAIVEPPAQCEHCGAHSTALLRFDSLDSAEAFSEEVSGA